MSHRFSLVVITYTSRLPKAKQRAVMQVLDSVLAQADH
jgi:hypothetical protein